MTAFERREAQGDWGGRSGRLTWELRSVNHRYLELHPRLPDELRAIEPQVRERARQRLGRGKLECTLRFSLEATGQGGLDVDWQRVDELSRIAAEIGRRFGNSAQPASTAEILRFPGVLGEPAVDLEPVREAAVALLDDALEGLRDTRRREGEQLAEHIRARAESARDIVAELAEQRGTINQRIRERLTARLDELPAPADPGRLEQELAYIAQRQDIDEELERLGTHLQEVLRLLEAAEPVGRRLDFLMQELNREANTIASKSGHVASSSAALDLKVLIEQMREQVQNVE
ncbi:YicC/YloC family endoribonuclease [Halorhodospira halophila]|nr:YicC/YloC family endoribonuclease [Halorhodospira halophila]